MLKCSQCNKPLEVKRGSRPGSVGVPVTFITHARCASCFPSWVVVNEIDGKLLLVDGKTVVGTP
jgi:hypothetical protein